MTDTEAAIVLNLLPQVGPVRVRRLTERFGSVAAILEANGSDLRNVEGIGPEVSSSITNWSDHTDLDTELTLVEKAGARVLTQADAEYPALLKEIHDPPIVLYILGQMEERDQRNGIGIVGTRRASHYATDATKKLGYQLAYSGLTIYSGLARGIDTAAHQAALAANGRTVAVLGSGLAHIYPEENIALAGKISSGSGAVISEFPMNMTPTKQTFPKRNRIISGCSFGLLVVEAGLNSGALISAREAGDQGRSLYAVPGRIDQPGTLGSNRLIQQGAKLVIDAGDILSDLPLLFAAPPELQSSRPRIQLPMEDLLVYEAIGDDPTPIDAIILKSGLPVATVSSRLLALELGRHVRTLPGNRFLKLI
ncbi:MAG: DNA-processing protein DprA [bacterium]